MNDELDRLSGSSRRRASTSRVPREHVARAPTPLNAIIGFSQVLRERLFGELNEKQAEYVDDICRRATTCSP